MTMYCKLKIIAICTTEILDSKKGITTVRGVVGMSFSQHPLHTSVRVLLTLAAPTSIIWRRSVLRDKDELNKSVGSLTDYFEQNAVAVRIRKC